MGLLNGIGALGKARGLLKGNSVSSGLNKPFRDTLRKSSFTTSGEVKAGKWIPVGTFQVGDRQLVNVGYGTDTKPENAGYLYTKLMSTDATPVVIEGKFRIVAKDTNDMGKDVVFSEDLDNLCGDANDKSKMIMLQQHPTEILNKEYVVLEVMSDADKTIDFTHADTKIKIPITKQYTD